MNKKILCLVGFIFLGVSACAQKHDFPTASDIEDAESSGTMTASNVVIHNCTLKSKGEMQQLSGKVMDVWHCQYSEVLHGQRGDMGYEANSLIGRDEDGKWHFIGIAN